VKVRVEAAQGRLLAGLQFEILRPETLDYIAAQLRALLRNRTGGQAAALADLRRPP
jgi:hypothetical protein